MTKHIVFATGNSSKFYEASKVCEKFAISLEQKSIEVDEIQHHDALQITEAKIRSAYDIVGVPVVVNDSSWEIPVLGGFPGGYMKDMTRWLSTSDFQLLMSDKDDKRIFLNEVVAYYDGITMNMFTHRREGKFVDDARGESLPSFARLVQMESDDMTISEIFDKGDWSIDNSDVYKHWYDFAKWYSEQPA